MKCDRCGAAATGAFCSNCGAGLKSTSACARCGSELPPGGRFCTQCGARAGGNADALRWAVPAGLVIVALALGYWLGGGAEEADAGALTSAPRMSGVPASQPGTPPPLTGSMRDQADRLFERIMQSRARGDSADAAFFTTMALQAYDGVDDLDADGHFHVGLLHLGAGSTSDAMASADRIAGLDPNHLFGSALRAEASAAAGDQGAARSAYTDFLSRFDAEVARGLPEYEMHRPALDEYRARAREATGG